MTGKRYSAGAIFLQVVPVFADVQRQIADEAKNIDRALGDQMERSGEKAGERAGKAASKAMSDEIKRSNISKDLEREILSGVGDLEKALSGVNTKNLGKKLREEVKGMRAELASLKDVDINVDDNLDQVAARVKAVQAQVEDMRKRSKVFFDIKGLPQVYRDITKVQKALDGVDGTIDVDVDTKVAERKIGAFERKFKQATEKAADALGGNVSKEARKIADELNYLSNLRIGIDISSSTARRELGEIRADLKKLEADSAEIDLKIDSGIALAELTAFEKALDKIDGRNVTATVKTNARSAGHDAEAAANSFRSFNIILLAAVSIGPALIPVLAGIAGGLLALGPASAVAAFGLGSVLVGFSGLGDALTALGNQQDQAATNAQTAANRQVSAARAIENAQDALSDARRNAARAAEDAADRVKEAREAAADAVEEALERQKDAQEEYRDSVQDVADAEQALRDAREDARKDAETLAKRQRQNAVDERQAVLDLFEAQSEFNAVMADGSATDTDKEQASINLEQAQIALNNTRDEQVALAEEAADYAKNGVDGSEQVKSAQDDLTAALEAQKDAQEAVKEAAEAADEARIEGAEAVKEALEDQREVLSDNARAIRRAKEAIADARQSAVSDLKQIDAQQQAVNAAFDKLGPAGRKFALFLFSLRSGFYDFRDAVQSAMLPAIQQAIEGFISSGNATKARDAIVALAEGFGKFTVALSRSFQGPAWAAFFEMLAELGPDIQKAYGDAFIKFLEAFASILTVTAPFALRFAEGLAAMADGLAGWAASGEGQKAILDFIAYVEKVGPAVLDFFGSLAGAAANTLRAMAPFGEVVLGLLTSFLDFIAEMDPKTLGAILSSFTVILLASQVAYAVMNASMALGALFALTIGPWVFLILGVAAALIFLYETNEDFRKFVTDAWRKVSKVIKKSWEEDIKPALTELWDAIKVLWKDVFQPFLEWLGPIILWMFETLFPLWAKWISRHIRNVSWLITEVLVPAAQKMGEWFKAAWEKFIKPAWEALVKAAKWVKRESVEAFGKMRTGWREFTEDVEAKWNKYGAPIMKTITETVLPALETAFKKAVDYIADQWDRLKRLVANPIRFVIEDVINGGLIAGFNKVSGWVNGPTLGEVAVPEALKFNTGGIMPGYTPGRDPHKFYSPTGGRLELSGGEAVMRPEWTAAMGPSYVDQMNALARSGGVSAIRRAMGFATGGIVQTFARGGKIRFPVPGGYVNRTEYNLGHDGMDINHPKDSTGRVPYYSATEGRVTTTGYSRGYGNAVFVASPYGELVYGHSYDGSVRVQPGDTVRPGTWLANIGNTGNSQGAHLHFGFPGGTFYAAEALLKGAVGVEDGDFNAIPLEPSKPSWLKSLVEQPVAWAKELISKPINAFKERFGGQGFMEAIVGIPRKLAASVGKYAKEVIPRAWDVVGNKLMGGPDKGDNPTAPGPESSLPGQQPGGSGLQLASGGILPYNGTMLYDNGGYLAPGLTTVMNLTGKPEPVFTDGQWRDMDGRGGGENFTYAPVINGSNLGVADLVDDLEFSRRKMRREGRYGRNQP